MNFTQSIVLFDVSAVLIMVILAYLSRPLGVALKIPPYYRLLYLTSLVIALPAIGETIGNDQALHIPAGHTDAPAVFFGHLPAFLVCLKYWNWLFGNFFRK